MPELRLALIGLGILFLVVLGLWEWRRSRRRPRQVLAEPSPAFETFERPRRTEPGMEGMAGMSALDRDEQFEVPVIHPVESVRVGVASEPAVDVPSAARFEAVAEPELEPGAAPELPVQVAPIQWPPREAVRILSLRVSGIRGQLLSGRDVRIALDAAGLRHGPQGIYHLATPEGAVLVSVANLVRPGELNPAQMDAQEYRGLSVFSVLPNVLSSARVLDELVGVARAMAHRVGGVVQDADGQDLDGVRLTQMQKSLDPVP